MAKQEIAAIEPEHSLLGASSCERWWNCPGSINLIEKLPNHGDKTSWDAAQGTVAHTVASSLLLQSLDGTKPEGVQIMSKHEVEGYRIIVDEAMLDGVDAYVDHIHTRIKTHKLDRWQCMVEHKVSIETPTPLKHPLRGTMDSGNYIPFVKLWVDDFKYGTGRVDVHENKQLLQYALGALHAIPEDEREDIPTIEVSIIQPRLIGGDGRGISTFEISRPDLEAWGEELIEHAYATEDPDAPRVPGTWCQYCPAKLMCAEYAADKAEILQADFADVEMPAVPLPLVYTNDQLAMIENNAARIKETLTAVHNLIYEKLQAGEKVGDYKLVEKRKGNSEWVDPLIAKEALAPLGKDAYTTPVLKSPTQIRKVIKFAAKKAKADNKDFTPPDIDALIMREDKGYTIARSGDSRPELLRSVEADFSDI